MFTFCSRYTRLAGRVEPSRARRRGRAALAILVMVLLTTPAIPREPPRNPHVVARQQAMAQARAAVDLLGAMAGGSRLFDANAAKAARRSIIRILRDLPGLFRREAGDAYARSRPEVWSARKDFRERARDARRAAAGVNTRTEPALRKSLPPLVSACLACHQIFRDDRRR